MDEDDALFEQALAELDAAPPAASQPAPAATPPDPYALTGYRAIDVPFKTAVAASDGAWKSIFETKDFLFGETPKSDRSWFRRSVETRASAMADQSLGYGVVGTVSQFTAAMVGLGKAVKAGSALTAGGRYLIQAGKTAAGGAGMVAEGMAINTIAFDPYEERLSNLIEQYPSLSTPITRFLSANPKDSRAEAYLKSALEGAGMDVALTTAFTAAAKAYRHFRAGDKKSAEEALKGATLPEEAGPTPSTAEASPAAVTRETSAPPPPAGNENLPVLKMPEPANDPGMAPEVLSQGNLAVAAERPLDAGQPRGRQNDVGLREGETAVPPEAVNTNFFFDDYTPASDRAGLANDNARPGTVGELLTQPAPPKVEPPAPAPSKGSAKSTVPNRKGIAPSASDIEGPPSRRTKSPTVAEATEETSESILAAYRADAEALAKYGSRSNAEAYGHKFADLSRVPTQKLDTPQDVEAFLTRAAEGYRTELDVAKGGDVLPDARLMRLVRQRVEAYGDEPADVLALFERAGKGAKTLAADMEAADAVGLKLTDDAYRVAEKIRLGQLDEWGGNEMVAKAEFAKRTALAMSVWGHARSMSSNSGRTLRRMRGDLTRLSGKDIEKIGTMPADQLLKLVQDTGGDVRQLREALNKPSLLARAQDGLSYLLVNNLLWGWKTHVVNLTTNAYMLGARPGEKWIGSWWIGGGEGEAIRRQAAYEFASFKSTLVDSFLAAGKALKAGESVLDPHMVEVHGVTSRAGADVPWRPIQNVGDLAYNALLGVWWGIGIPTRLLGGADEMVKQIRYRSVVLADAQLEADGLRLSGQARTDFVAGRLNAAIDEAGQATNTRALNEARVATFQQELASGTYGHTIQAAVANHPEWRLVLPFVKTPTNVLRYGVKYTPGLNLLQTEYREMLMGARGAEAQAQAAGQMALGGLAVGTAAALVADGRFTGTGPKDPKKRAELVAHGWQPNSIVWKNEDGTTSYFPLGRFDPVGLPFGIVADLMDVLQHSDKIAEGDIGIGALVVAISKQVTDRTYLQNLNQFIQALSDPEKHFGRVANNQAGNFVPFSSALKMANPDPYMREVRTLVDGIMAKVPGLSEKLPAKYDAFGDPIVVRKGLMSTTADDVVDNEIIRMGMASGGGEKITVVAPPTPYHNGKDLRDITLEDGRNAHAVLQEYSGRPSPHGLSLKQSLARIVGQSAYAKAVDGASSDPGTKQWMLAGVTSKYHEAGFKRLLAESPKVRNSLMEARIKAAAAFKTDAKAAGDTKALEALANTYGLTLGR